MDRACRRMEHRDRVRERFSPWMSILAGAVAVRERALARRRRRRLRGRGSVFSFLCPFFFGESDPLALFGLPNQRGPAFRLWIERELIRELAVFGKKSKFNAEQFVIEFSTAEGGKGCAKNVDPVANITFGILVETDENERLIFGFRVGCAVMKLDKLVIQHPFATNTRLFHATL